MAEKPAKLTPKELEQMVRGIQVKKAENAEALEQARREASQAKRDLTRTRQQIERDQNEIARLQKQVEQMERRASEAENALTAARLTGVSKPQGDGKVPDHVQQDLQEIADELERAKQEARTAKTELNQANDRAAQAEERLRWATDERAAMERGFTRQLKAAQEEAERSKSALAHARSSFAARSAAIRQSGEDTSFLGLSRTCYRTVEIPRGGEGTIFAFEQSAAAAITGEVKRKLEALGFKKVELLHLFEVSNLGYIPIISVYVAERNVTGLVAFQCGEPIAIVAIKGTLVITIETLLSQLETTGRSI